MLAALLALLMLVAAGCDGDDEAVPPPETTGPVETTPQPTPETSTFAVYLLRDGVIAPVRRTVASTPAVARASLEALMTGPTGAEESDGLVTRDPRGTTLLDVSVADGVATVDLSGTFDDGGGSASMLGRVAQVVATLTQFPTIERVAFRLDGEPVETIGGEGVVVDPPIGRTRDRGAVATDPDRVAAAGRHRHEPDPRPRDRQRVRGDGLVRGARRDGRGGPRGVHHRNVRHGHARDVRHDARRCRTSTAR